MFPAGSKIWAWGGVASALSFGPCHERLDKRIGFATSGSLGAGQNGLRRVCSTLQQLVHLRHILSNWTALKRPQHEGILACNFPMISGCKQAPPSTKPLFFLLWGEQPPQISPRPCDVDWSNRKISWAHVISKKMSKLPMQSTKMVKGILKLFSAPVSNRTHANYNCPDEAPECLSSNRHRFLNCSMASKETNVVNESADARLHSQSWKNRQECSLLLCNVYYWSVGMHVSHWAQYLIKLPCSSKTTSPQLQFCSIFGLKQLKPSQPHKHHKIKLLHLTNLHHEEPGGLGCIFTNLPGSMRCVQFQGQTAPTRCHPEPPTRLSCLCQTSIPASALHPHTKLLSIPLNGIKYNYMLYVIVSQLEGWKLRRRRWVAA